MDSSCRQLRASTLDGTLTLVIDVRVESLLPIKSLPEYLDSRGFGKRVSMRAVKRWVAVGCNGARLETVTIDRAILTSLEAIQRWVERQTGPQEPNQALAQSTDPSGPPPTAGGTTGPGHRASLHFLTEHRVLPTELDRVIEKLDHPRSTRAFAAGLLFRAGFRTPADVLQKGLDSLLKIRGLGGRSEAVVRSLWTELQGEPRNKAPEPRPREAAITTKTRPG